MEAVEEELRQLAAHGGAAARRQIRVTLEQGTSITLRSPRGIVHLTSPRVAGAGPHAGPAERIRLLEESISDEAEKHRRLEVLGVMAVRANVAAASPSPAPRLAHSPAPSSVGSGQKLGAHPRPTRVRAHCPPPARLCVCVR